MSDEYLNHALSVYITYSDHFSQKRRCYKSLLIRLRFNLYDGYIGSLWDKREAIIFCNDHSMNSKSLEFKRISNNIREIS